MQMDRSPSGVFPSDIPTKIRLTCQIPKYADKRKILTLLKTEKVS
jgi:hypothetical protein